MFIVQQLHVLRFVKYDQGQVTNNFHLITVGFQVLASNLKPTVTKMGNLASITFLIMNVSQTWHACPVLYYKMAIRSL